MGSSGKLKCKHQLWRTFNDLTAKVPKFKNVEVLKFCSKDICIRASNNKERVISYLEDNPLIRKGFHRCLNYFSTADAYKVRIISLDIVEILVGIGLFNIIPELDCSI